MREGTRILMVAGGTGGHIFPALAVAEELFVRGERLNRHYEIEFLGTHRPLEARLIPAAGFRLRTVDAAGLKGIGGLQRLRNLLVLPRTAIAVAKILREFRPQVVVGVGGYLAGPVMLEAALVGIPTVLIEPNARPGFTNRLLAPVVRRAAVGFAEAARLYGKKAQVTGLPVRPAFFEIAPHRRAPLGTAPPGATVPPVAQPLLAVPRPPFTILVIGGSQGSRAINQVVIASLSVLEGVEPTLRSAPGDVAPGFSPAPGVSAPGFSPAQRGNAATRDAGAGGAGPGPDAVRPCNPDAGLKPGSTSDADAKAGITAGGIRIIHQTGEHDYNEVRKTYQERGLVAEVHAFIDDMPGVLAQADLVISRAGAMAVAELAAAGRAGLLIPFPGATDQHQLENARAMEKAGAARVIVQSELSPQRLAGEIRELLASPATLEKMESSARRLAKPGAAGRIADLVEGLVRKD
jgi:UDP-N-acetylglucosamine--N-acetylmuramyl-(pentapeptide) pyrophosphoryl-undecaprenol N-acetylglucosamine transferase